MDITTLKEANHRINRLSRYIEEDARYEDETMIRIHLEEIRNTVCKVLKEM